jgi:hypothetical protein
VSFIPLIYIKDRVRQDSFIPVVFFDISATGISRTFVYGRVFVSVCKLLMNVDVAGDLSDM